MKRKVFDGVVPQEILCDAINLLIPCKYAEFVNNKVKTAGIGNHLYKATHQQGTEEQFTHADKAVVCVCNKFKRSHACKEDTDKACKNCAACKNNKYVHACKSRYKNKYIWDDNVAIYILLKSDEDYFNDPVCKNGYFRGRETFNFVKDILGRAEMYKQKIKD